MWSATATAILRKQEFLSFNFSVGIMTTSTDFLFSLEGLWCLFDSKEIPGSVFHPLQTVKGS